MKITSGVYSGIPITVPGGRSVRPTLSKTRQSLFNMLRGKIEGLKCVDFFGGSGALGFEAMSNGAESAVFVENKYGSMIYKNAAKLKISRERFSVIKADFRKGLAALEKKGYKAGIIFADPPYNRGFAEIFLKLLEKSDILVRNGYVVIEVHRDEASALKPEKLRVLKEKKYGETVVLLLENS